MGILTIVLIVIWISTAFEGIYGIAKGYFRHEREKAKKHEPNAYRKWVRLSSVFLIIFSVLNIIWCILDGATDAFDFKYVVYVIITVAVFIAAIAVAYILIVKPADKANGIESDFDRILKENKQ